MNWRDRAGGLAPFLFFIALWIAAAWACVSAIDRAESKSQYALDASSGTLLLATQTLRAAQETNERTLYLAIALCMQQRKSARVNCAASFDTETGTLTLPPLGEGGR